MKWLSINKSVNLSPAVLLQQLASLLAAGISITRCLDTLEKSTNDMTARMRIFKIKMYVLAGHALHHSLRTIPEWFDTYAIKLVHLGEQTGKLDVVLTALAQHYANKTALNRKIRGILFYPCLILLTALLLTLAMFIFIIPTFADLFRDTQQNLPWLTRFLFHLSALLNQFILPVLLFALLGMTFMFFVLKRNRSTFIMKLMDLPLLRRMTHAMHVIRFTRHLALALEAGMPLLNALQLCSELGANSIISSHFRRLRITVSSGASFYAAVTPLTLFPSLLKQMIKTGEETGQLDRLLNKAAEMLETELETNITQFTALLEPLIMVILGVLIGGLVIGMYLPVFNLGSAL